MPGTRAASSARSCSANAEDVERGQLGRLRGPPEGRVALFNHAVAWLRRHRVLLPGVSVLARQVSAARTAAENRLHSSVARAAYRADPALPPALVALLPVPEGARRSELERLRRPPTRSTGTAMAKALDRVNEISGFGLGRVNLSRVPVNRLATLARYGMASKAAALERAPEPRRTALMTAVMRNLEAAAIDDALDLFALLMSTPVAVAGQARDRQGAAGEPAAAGARVPDAEPGVRDAGEAAGGSRPGPGGVGPAAGVAGAGGDRAPRQDHGGDGGGGQAGAR
jgi:hypothetical protein